MIFLRTISELEINVRAITAFFCSITERKLCRFLMHLTWLDFPFTDFDDFLYIKYGWMYLCTSTSRVKQLHLTYIFAVFIIIRFTSPLNLPTKVRYLSTVLYRIMHSIAHIAATSLHRSQFNEKVSKYHLEALSTSPSLWPRKMTNSIWTSWSHY